MNWDGRIRADARMLPIASDTVQCVVTSPPYYGLRNYGDAKQIGLERTHIEYVESLRVVFRELWRVLREDGTAWLNIGDSYASGKGTCFNPGGNTSSFNVHLKAANVHPLDRGNKSSLSQVGLKPKDLIGIPWRVAFALQEDGWYLRRDIIWAKPNPMPESVTDRCTSSHEYIFMLTKSGRYYYDRKAIAEPHTEQSVARRARARTGGKFIDSDGGQPSHNPHSITTGLDHCLHPDGANKRSVWTVSTQPYPEAHYATFPEEIPEICIKAGTKPGDVVLDPFFGSGTVGRVAERLSRRWVGIDLGYQDLQAKRLRTLQKELVVGI